MPRPSKIAFTIPYIEDDILNNHITEYLAKLKPLNLKSICWIRNPDGVPRINGEDILVVLMASYKQMYIGKNIKNVSWKAVIDDAFSAFAVQLSEDSCNFASTISIAMRSAPDRVSHFKVPRMLFAHKK